MDKSWQLRCFEENATGMRRKIMDNPGLAASRTVIVTAELKIKAFQSKKKKKE